MKHIKILWLALLLVGRALAFTSPAWSVNQPIYEVNLQMFSPAGTYVELQKHLPELKALGVGIIWLMPITSRGVLKAFGSPYSVKDYRGLYTPYGSGQDLKNLIGATHRLGMHLILDWVGNHSSWDNALITEHPEFYKKDLSGNIAQAYAWPDAAQLNYDNPRLRLWMIEAMKYWLQNYDIDGFRCDVAWGVPIDFWVQARRELEKIKPVFMLAESNDPADERAFDADYDWALMGTSKVNRLTDIAQGSRPVSLIGDLVTQDSMRFSPGFMRMRFTSNHDEWKDHGTPFERFGAGLKAFAVLMSTLPGKPMIYNGQEIGWNQKEGAINWAPSTESASYRAFYTVLFHAYQDHPALSNGLWRRITLNADNSICAYLRQSGADKIIVVINLSAQRIDFKLEDPILAGSYSELFSGARYNLGPSVHTAFNPWEYRVLAGRADPVQKISELQGNLEADYEKVEAKCEDVSKIDAQLGKPEWSGPWTGLNRLSMGVAADASAQYQVRWNLDDLFVAVRVLKKKLFHDSADDTPWNDDSVEVYLDMKHERSVPYQDHDFHFIVGYHNPHLFESRGRTAGVEFADSARDDGYGIEMAIPWKVLKVSPSKNSIYGFDVSVNLADPGGVRRGVLTWCGDDQDYRDTSLFGDLVLGPECQNANKGSDQDRRLSLKPE